MRGPGPGDGEERGAGRAPAPRRLASWLRARSRIERPADAPDPVESPAAPAADRPAEPPRPASRLRRQPEGDASVYPLF
ncbi:hypothetical protein [Streptomyces sp. NPDC002889]|uniref:hypothetical protein n=1 Tax=Streptomyces sp. NPDC002889 TaxID=3364669 RepID=UPI0036764605